MMNSPYYFGPSVLIDSVFKRAKQTAKLPTNLSQGKKLQHIKCVKNELLLLVSDGAEAEACYARAIEYRQRLALWFI
jgi:hypothetical protein